jgi:hypothetical protein
MQVCGDNMGLGLWEAYEGPLMRRYAQLLIFWWYKPFSMEDCVAFVFLRSWALVVPYLCSTFCIFDRLVLEEYVL